MVLNRLLLVLPMMSTLLLLWLMLNGLASWAVVVEVVPFSVLDEVVVLVFDLTALLVLELASAVLSTVLSLAAVAVALSF